MERVSRGVLSTVVAAMFTTALASTAHAQSPQQYLLGGWSLELREGSRNVGDYPRRALNGVTFSGGLYLGANISLEASLSAFLPSTTDWSFGYTYPSGDKRTTDRDVLLTALARWSQPCTGRVCMDILGGAGFNRHIVSTTAVTSCPPPGVPGSCVDVNQPAAETDYYEPVVLAGLDFKVKISERLALLPGFRAGGIWRKRYLTQYDFRGPQEGSWPFATANVALLYVLK